MATKKAKDEAPVEESDVAPELPEPVPNVQSEPDHASYAPEDTRDAAVAGPNA